MVKYTCCGGNSTTPREPLGDRVFLMEKGKKVAEGGRELVKEYFEEVLIWKVSGLGVDDFFLSSTVVQRTGLGLTGRTSIQTDTRICPKASVLAWSKSPQLQSPILAGAGLKVKSGVE
ncbi:MAG: hypothetical protein Q9N34_09115 [Aquificota bacterium]|nr:hypothetical protein [Aquificota bacterium]